MKVALIDLPRQYETIALDIDGAIRDVVASGRFILGPQVALFEREFAAYCHAAHAVGVASGTDALRLALEALGVGPGHEVIVPAFTFVATAEVVTQLGAVPVFADVEPRFLGLDPADVARKLTDRTRAVIPVHLYGHTADVTGLRRLTEPRGVWIVEDAAQAVGAEHGGRRAGSLGHVACFSFFPTKNLGAYGDAGALTTNDPAIAERLRMLRDHGSRTKYVHERVGWCSRLDEIQAAVLRVKLRHLDAWTERRRALAADFGRALAGLPLRPPEERPGDRHVYHLFTIRTPRRDALRTHLEQAGIATAIHYPVPLHHQPVYRTPGAASLPVSEQASAEVVSLPFFPELRADEVDAVIAGVRTFFSP
jgi:dTDP-4-amino-4,6-dideoxygalactose transaminase